MVAMRTRFTTPQVLLLLVVAFIAGNVTRGLFQRDHHALQRCTAIEISESEASGAAADERGSPQGGAELAQLLAAVAVNNTVVTTLASNSSVFADVRTTTGLFPLWWKSMRKAGVDNVLVAAADLQSLDWLRAAGVPAVLRSVERCNASWVACAKFDLLRDVTRLGYNVLFLDTDLLVFKNPLHHLVGDSDFEATTEGFGASDGSDPAPGPHGDYKLLHFRGWPPLHFYRLPQINFGVVWARGTPRVAATLAHMAAVQRQEDVWDQHLFSKLLLFPRGSGSEWHGRHSVRLMDPRRFPTSCQTMFFFNSTTQLASLDPVALHFACTRGDRRPIISAVWQAFISGRTDYIRKSLQCGRHASNSAQSCRPAENILVKAEH